MARPECGYCDKEDIKDALATQWTSGATQDTLLEDLIFKASRLIDEELHWPVCFFAIDDRAETVQYYDTDAGLELWINRCTSIKKLEVDQDGDQVYEETWVEATDFVLWPYNEGWFDKVIVLEGTARSFPTGQRRVKIEGNWGGFDTPPHIIQQACLITAVRWFKRGLQMFQDTGAIVELGQLTYTKALDPDVAEIIRIFGRRVGIG